MAKAELIKYGNITRTPEGGRIASASFGDDSIGYLRVKPNVSKSWWHGLSRRTYKGHVDYRSTSSSFDGFTARTGRGALSKLKDAYNVKHKK